MDICREYESVWFNADTVEEAARTILDMVGEDNVSYGALRLSYGRDTIRVDTLDEFLAEVRDRAHEYSFSLEVGDGGSGPSTLRGIQIWQHKSSALVNVYGTSRAAIVRVLSVFDRNEGDSQLPEPVIPPKPPPRIFIGHGRPPDWKELKDHLQDQHGYNVAAYEVGARAGHTIRDILADMLTKSSFALLVMTPEDETAEGKYHPRLNVVHEAGLFQGRLGFSRAIILLKEGTEELSNIYGLQQVRYANIRETFGDVLATLRREFSP